MITLVHLLVFIVLIALLAWWQRRGVDLSLRVLVALLAGAALGTVLRMIHGKQSPVPGIDWLDHAVTVYIWLLELMVLPLMAVAILSAVVKLGTQDVSTRIRVWVLSILLVTTVISSAMGIALIHVFGVTIEGLVAQSTQTSIALPWRQESLAMTGILALLLGLAAIVLQRESAASGGRIAATVELAKVWVVRMVRLVLALTPYGVLAWMTSAAASAGLGDLLGLGGFAIVIHLGFVLVLLVHAGFLAVSGINPVRYFKAASPVLRFAFSSGSSAAAMPKNVDVQTCVLGVSKPVAGFSASIGTTVGQNACAGLFPAMLAAMIAASAGVDVTSPAFAVTLILVASLASLGIASTGGGATFAALLVLALLDMPVALAGLMICLEPIIDMGRTAVNVNGSMVAGAITNRWANRSQPERLVEED